eukprot:XP_002259323.1 hypothetical protein, conserved in Plasmodium species [Plasmodium knowlesi strain H]
MEESHVEPFILFEGENNVNSDNFCYEYKAKSIRKGLSRTQSYRNLSSRSRMSKWACKNGAPFNFAIWEITPRCSSRFAQLSDLGMIGKHNLDDFLYNEDQRRRRRDGVPMLWLHDSTATYSTSRTVQGGVKHK